MGIVYVLLPLSLFLAIVGGIAFVWSTKSGQFEDLDTPARRVLFDDKPSEVSPKPPENET